MNSIRTYRKWSPTFALTRRNCSRFIAVAIVWSLLLSAALAGDKTNSQIFSAATNALLKGNYPQSITLFESLNAAGIKTPALYCNLGNAYFQSGRPAIALAYYEKALMLAPNDSQLMNNVKIASVRLKQPADTNFNACVNNLSLSKACMLPALIALLLAGIIYFLVSARLVLGFTKGISLIFRFIISFAALILVISSVSFVYNSSFESGIVTAACDAKAAPNGLLRSGLTFSVGEGVQIINYYDGWYKIQTAGGARGWIAANDFMPVN